MGLASWAGAMDVAAPGAGRQAGVVPAAMPNNFSTGLQLQRGLTMPSINTSVGNAPSLPSMADLRALGETWFGLRDDNAAPIPALPQSLVVLGEASNGALLPTLEAGQSPDVTRVTPPAPGSQVLGMRRVSQELTEKTSQLQAPIETVAKKGPNAASSEGFRRAGDEIWDILAAPSRGDDQSMRGAGVMTGALRGGTVGSGLSASDSSSLGVVGSRGFLTAFGTVPAPIVEAEGAVNAGGRTFLFKTSSLNDASETSADGRTAFAPRGVALITMNVVGQTLVLSDAGAMAAARRAAVAAMGVTDSSGSGAWERRVSRESANWAMAETVGSRTIESGSVGRVDALPESNTVKSDFGAVKAERARAGFLSNVFEAPGLWSLAAFLPLLLLALAALPERLA